MKDIIFRSFIIPWMQANEVRGVVEFEVSKYIPFSIEELSYSFHSLTTTENNVKRLRIIFVAIKKNTLDKYINAFEQRGLQIDVIEPAALSLIRVLSIKKLIPIDQTIAIIEKNESSGKIIIVDQEIPQFSREFQIKLGTTVKPESDPQTKILRFINEARISLDYFNRQQNQIRVKQIILLTPTTSEELTKKIEDDLGKPVIPINLTSILGDNAGKNMGYLSAFGSALANLGGPPTNFQFSRKKSKTAFSLGSTTNRLNNYRSVVLTLFLCIPAIILFFFSSNKLLDNPRIEEATLTQKLGNFKSFSIESLNENSEKLKKELLTLENIRIKSSISHFLSIIPNLLPEGTWIKNFLIIYAKPSQGIQVNDQQSNIKDTLSLELSGFAFLENTQEQFRLVNTFLKKLKDTADFSSFFGNIDLETIKSQKLGSIPVTFFRIKCQ
ncbi:MAG: hypothetical protein A2Z81_07940 [Omnitrophica WOR_2 bacterium GWA2_45_18]|nr:MAG: hypothetical protein A2Z81_07940 [Omnitrophica WOR_2 bacterium GWA2_45_18]